MNHVSIIGNLGKDPELRYSSSGTAVATLSIAVNERITRNGERQEHTSWFQVVCWARLAENVAQYLQKGSRVAVEGSLRQRTYETGEGQRRSVVEIAARTIDFLDNRSSGQEKGEYERPEDDIPF